MKFKGFFIILAIITGIFSLSLGATNQVDAAHRITPTPTKTPRPTPTRIPSPTPQIRRLGGMNLDGYCGSRNQGSARLSGSTWVCTAGQTINLSSACQWQYALSTAYAVQETANNPYTWACYTSSGTPTPTPTLAPTLTPTPTATPTPTVAPTITPTPTATPSASGPYYIALGDSFAFGYHLAQYQHEDETHTYTPESFNDGYDADFYHSLQSKIAGLQEINYSCPGETSGSFISGGCSFHTTQTPLHTDYPVSEAQLQVVREFLLSHPGKQIITIDIGVNDAINLSITCQQQADSKQCFLDNTPGVLSVVKQNYDRILDTIREVSPLSDVIIVKFPNPVYQEGSDDLGNGLNKIQDDEASSRSLKIADTFSIFTADNVCSLTNFCSDPSDFHPNADGYRAMANVIFSTSGY